MVPAAIVDGVPLPWSIGFALDGGALAYATVDAPGATLQLRGPVVGGVIGLRLIQGDVMKTKQLALA